jgi:CRP-like cAMP-binding protein
MKKMKCDCGEFLSKGCWTTEKCIKGYWLFKDLNRSQAEEVQRIGLRKYLKKGSFVFTQGDSCDEMFLIKIGRIKLYKVNEDGSEVTLDFRKAGDLIGENIFTGQENYPLNARAMEDTITCGFNKKNFNKLIFANPDIALRIIQSMSVKMSSMTDRLEGLAGNSLENRLYSVLLNVAKEHGTIVDDGLAINFPLTHEDLGFLIGAHRVSITKAMKSLIHSGKIVFKGKKTILSHHFL